MFCPARSHKLIPARSRDESPTPAEPRSRACRSTSFQAATNGEGIYRIQSLQPGTYQLTYVASGFKRMVRDSVTLQTGAVLPVDVSLEIGSSAESVQVTAEGTLLETETSSTGTVTEGEVLYKLFGKITGDVATANLQGEPLMNLMLRLTW